MCSEEDEKTRISAVTGAPLPVFTTKWVSQDSPIYKTPGPWAASRPIGWAGGGLSGKNKIFPLHGVSSLPGNNNTLSLDQEMKFLFIVAATLTDISVQLNKGKEHIKYITIPQMVQRWGGRAGPSGQTVRGSTFSGCAASTFQAHVYRYFIYIIYIYV